MKAHNGKAGRALVAVMLGALACGGGGSAAGTPEGQPPPAVAYSPAVHTLVLEVAWAPGAAPYTGPLPGFGDTWSVLTANASRLFQGGGKTLEVPTTLGEMESLPAVTGTDFTTDQVLAVAARYRSRYSTADTVTYFVVFLNGYFNDGTQRRTDVPGASFGTTGVVAIFKPVIVSATAGMSPAVSRIVEQSTLVHEFGHATGLVNNGLTMTAAHQDSAHGLHCSNPGCIMYYTNEGSSEAVQFAMRYARTDNPVLFGPECLADAALGVRTGQ